VELGQEGGNRPRWLTAGKDAGRQGARSKPLGEHNPAAEPTSSSRYKKIVARQNKTLPSGAWKAFLRAEPGSRRKKSFWNLDANGTIRVMPASRPVLSRLLQKNHTATLPLYIFCGEHLLGTGGRAAALKHRERRRAGAVKHSGLGNRGADFANGGPRVRIILRGDGAVSAATT